MKEGLTVIGLGALGLPIACNLVRAGYDVWGCDLSEEARRKFVEADGRIAETFSQLPDHLRTAVIIVANEAQVDKVLWGEAGLFALAPTITTVVLVTTVSPGFVARTSRAVEATGRRLVEAPVSGGVARAVEGTLSTIICGDLTDDERRVLMGFCSRIFDAGGAPGTASAVKLLNQVLCATNVVATIEVARVTRMLGLDPAVVHDFICASSGNSHIFKDRYPKIFQEEDRVGSTVDIYTKDTLLACELAAGAGGDLPLMQLVHRQFQSFSANGLGHIQDYRMADFDDPQPKEGGRPAVTR